MYSEIILSGVIVMLLCPLLAGLKQYKACIAVSVVGLVLVILGISISAPAAPAVAPAVAPVVQQRTKPTAEVPVVHQHTEPTAEARTVEPNKPKGIVSSQSSEIDQNNFKKNKEEDVVVVYVMETCIHCKNLMPLLKKVVEENHKTVYEIKNDTEENKRHIRDVGVNGFPTMRKYKGNWKNFQEFDKGRTYNNLLEFFLS